MEGPGTILTANVFTYMRPGMLDRCLESISPVCDNINVVNGHIKAEVRQNIEPDDALDSQTGFVLSKWREKLRPRILEWWNREASNFQDQSNFLVRRCPQNEWFFWICDDEALLGPTTHLRETLEKESTDFLTMINYGRTNPEGGIYYSRFIKRRDDTEFFPVHWQIIHRHQHIDLYNRQLSTRLYVESEIWDLEEYPGPGLPSVEEARAWRQFRKPGP